MFTDSSGVYTTQCSSHHTPLHAHPPAGFIREVVFPNRRYFWFPWVFHCYWRVGGRRIEGIPRRYREGRKTASRALLPGRHPFPWGCRVGPTPRVQCESLSHLCNCCFQSGPHTLPRRKSSQFRLTLRKFLGDFYQMGRLFTCVMILPENSFMFGEFGNGCQCVELHIRYLFLPVFSYYPDVG